METSDDKPKRKTVKGEASILDAAETFIKLVSAFSAAWLIGYFRFSLVWVVVPVALFVYRQRQVAIKKHKIKISQELAEDEKSVLLATIEELPSWVNFPDVERAEWVNKIVHKLWPYIGEFVEKMLRDKVEPLVKSKLPSQLQSFKFSTIDLGDVSPRVDGIKVFSHLRRDEMYMDVELNFASDCDLAVSLLGVSAGIKDFMLHGTLRVVLKPLINKAPLIAGVRIFFLNDPDLHFTLTSLASAFDLPGVSDILHAVIKEQLGKFVVLPNCIPIRLVDDVDMRRLRYPLPQGVVRVNVVEGRDLMEADFSITGKKSSDPYVVLKIGPTEAKTVKTRVISDDLNPVWNETFEIVVDSADGQLLYIDVFDEDPGSKDDELGRLSLDLTAVKEKGFEDEWLPLEDVKQGMIHLQLTWLWLANDPDELDRILEEDDGNTPADESKKHAAILIVYLESATQLPRCMKTLQQPSPQATLTVGQQTAESKVDEDTIEPLWEENFRFMVHNPIYQSLEVEINDANSKSSVGEVVVKLKDLMDAEDMILDQRFHVKTSEPGSCVSMRLELKALTTRYDPKWTENADGQLLKENGDKKKKPPASDSVNKDQKDADHLSKRLSESEVLMTTKPEKTAHNVLRRAKTVDGSALVSRDQHSRASDTTSAQSVDCHTNQTEDQTSKHVEHSEDIKENMNDVGLTSGSEFSPEKDCRAISNVMKLFGVDEDIIIDILGNRSASQRQQIVSAYSAIYDKDLSKELSHKLRGNIKTLVTSLLDDKSERDAKYLHTALKGFGTDEAVLIEILFSRSNDELKQIKKAYKKMFDSDLDSDVADDTSGDLRRLLLGCLQANRPEGAEFDASEATRDSKVLYREKDQGWESSESSLQKLLASCSYSQLCETFQAYAELAGSEIEHSIESSMSGDIKGQILSIVKIIRKKASYFAETIHTALKGFGSDDDTLVRIVVTRCEVDMLQIKEEFQRKFDQSLATYIAKDTSGHYRKLLLTLIGEPEQS